MRGRRKSSQSNGLGNQAQNGVTRVSLICEDGDALYASSAPRLITSDDLFCSHSTVTSELAMAGACANCGKDFVESPQFDSDPSASEQAQSDGNSIDSYQTVPEMELARNEKLPSCEMKIFEDVHTILEQDKKMTISSHKIKGQPTNRLALTPSKACRESSISSKFFSAACSCIHPKKLKEEFLSEDAPLRPPPFGCRFCRRTAETLEEVTMMGPFHAPDCTRFNEEAVHAAVC